MPDIRCPHCGAPSFTVTGWADMDRCPGCGRPLGPTPEISRDRQMAVIPSRRGELRYAYSRRAPTR